MPPAPMSAAAVPAAASGSRLGDDVGFGVSDAAPECDEERHQGEAGEKQQDAGGEMTGLFAVPCVVARSRLRRRQ